MHNQTTFEPYFHYLFKGQLNSTVIDSQYSFEGNYLAVSLSNGTILIYKSPIDQSVFKQTQRSPNIQFKSPIKNNCFLKLSWSFFDSCVFAAVSINKQISIFLIEKNTISLYKSIKQENIPLFCTFLPSFYQSLLAVAFSDGYISLVNQELDKIVKVQAHQLSVNWLSWERRLALSERNKWIIDHFPSYLNQNLVKKPPLLVSCSSDCFIKLWSIENGKLEQIHQFKAHTKQIRQVMWRPNYFNNSRYRHIVSCSEDGYIKFWEIDEQKYKIKEKMKSERNFNGPVFRTEYNLLGNLLAISYQNKEQGKLQTKVFSDKEGVLGQEIGSAK